MRRLTAVFELVELTTMTVRPNRTMLPPIWVDACDSQRRRKPLLRKTASGPASSGPGVVGSGGCGSVLTRLGTSGSGKVEPSITRSGRRSGAPSATRPRSGRGRRD